MFFFFLHHVQHMGEDMQQMDICLVLSCPTIYEYHWQPHPLNQESNVLYIHIDYHNLFAVSRD